MVPLSVVAFLPSPSTGIFKIGPLSLHAYGMCIALAMIAAVSLSSRRWVARGGHKNDVGSISTIAIPAGIIGARLYHVATDAASFRGRWGDAFKIWEGGLGIWGGIGLGTAVGLIVARTKGLSLLSLLDVVAPALPLAQAIGRWGNWFNQELYGRPSNLPWAVKIAYKNRKPDEFRLFETFHPTFLYESLWNLLVVGMVLSVERKFNKRLKPGRLFAVYVAGYTFGRFFIERMRVDQATRIFGQRINIFVSLVLFVFAILMIITGIQNRPAATVESSTTPAI